LKDEKPFADAIRRSLAEEIRLLPAEREAPAEAIEADPNELRRQLNNAGTFEEFNELKRQYRAAMEQSLIGPLPDDVVTSAPSAGTWATRWIASIIRCRKSTKTMFFSRSQGATP
jgi:hypothetical protein